MNYIRRTWNATSKSNVEPKSNRPCHGWSVWFLSIWFSFSIENWKSKLHNRDFQCLILKNWKSKIYNLNFQCLLLRKVKLNIILQYFENQKLKIENGRLVVLTFCFQFPPPKIQAINNSSVANSARNGVTAGEIQNKNRFFD